MAKRFSVEVGDNVAYSVQFLRGIGMSHSDMACGRGVVTEVKRYGDQFSVATIDWGGADLPDKVNVKNLAKVGSNARFCAC